MDGGSQDVTGGRVLFNGKKEGVVESWNRGNVSVTIAVGGCIFLRARVQPRTWLHACAGSARSSFIPGRRLNRSAFAGIAVRDGLSSLREAVNREKMASAT